MKALSLSLATDQATLLTPQSLVDVAASTQQTVWIGLHFPTLALQVCDFADGVPALVMGSSGAAGGANQQMIYAACTVAMDHGIVPGMSLSAAHALCQNVAIKVRDGNAEYQRLLQYVKQLNCFTPSISLGRWQSAGTVLAKAKARPVDHAVSGPEDNADSLLLEVSGSLQLFGGLDNLLQRIGAEFAEAGSDANTAIRHRPIVSVAPCPAAALLLARSGMEMTISDQSELKSVLGKVALAQADLSEKLVLQLGRCGLHTLRDLWRLPREDLGRRFGAGILDYLDRLSGQRQQPLQSVKPMLNFRQRMELPVDTRSDKLILIAVERLLVEACRFLQMHAAATEKMAFDLWHINRAYGSRSRTRILLHCGRAERQFDCFMPQFVQQLERAVMDDDVNAVSISIDQVVPYARSSEDLFKRRDRDQQQWQQLMDLLGARLGQDQIYTLQPVADHRPEYAWRRKILRPDSSVATRQSTASSKRHLLLRQTLLTLPPRPLWLILQPCKVDDQKLSLQTEAERIEAGWWQRRDIRRDYSIAHHNNGQQCWVYQKRGDTSTKSHWYLHGLFG